MSDVSEVDSAEGYLVLIQRQLKVPKSEYNAFGKYNYRTLETINQFVKPIANLVGCTVTYGDEIVYINQRYYVKATCTLITPKGSLSTCAYAREAEDRRGMDPAQVTGAASTYARKYAAQGLFALDGEMDADELTSAPSSNKWPSGTFDVICNKCGNHGTRFDARTAETIACNRCGATDWVIAK